MSNMEAEDSPTPLMERLDYMKEMFMFDPYHAETCEMLKAALRAMGWVSVDERLPEDEQTTWVWATKRFHEPTLKTYYSYDKKSGWLGMRQGEVTHWMPRPAPPTTKEPE